MDTKIFDVLHQPVRHDQEAGVDSTILAWSDNLMLMKWQFAHKGYVIPLHRHEHEQLTTILKGSMRVTLPDGSVREIHAGDALCFAPNEEHGLVILEDDTVAMDVFSPMRADHLARHTCP